MLASISAAQFTEWLGLDLLERELNEEDRIKGALEREALSGAHEIRGRIRGE